jgi:hypothetical protein
VYYVCSYNNRNHAKFTPALFLCRKSLAQKNHLHKFACCGRYVGFAFGL